jgi:hypothetical protein
LVFVVFVVFVVFGGAKRFLAAVMQAARFDFLSF